MKYTLKQLLEQESDVKVNMQEEYTKIIDELDKLNYTWIGEDKLKGWDLHEKNSKPYAFLNLDKKGMTWDISCEGDFIEFKDIIFETPEDKIEKIEEGLKLVTPAIINDANETWQNFTDALNALYNKAKKIKSKKSLETLTAKIKEI